MEKFGLPKRSSLLLIQQNDTLVSNYGTDARHSSYGSSSGASSSLSGESGVSPSPAQVVDPPGHLRHDKPTGFYSWESGSEGTRSSLNLPLSWSSIILSRYGLL